MTQPETRILHAVRDYLRWHGWLVYRNVAGIGTPPGLADLTVLKDGAVVQIEVKTPRGRLSAAQHAFKEDWQLHGGSYIVARSVDDVEGMSDGHNV